MKHPFLIGPRLYLRPVDPADVDLFLRWFNHPDVRRTLRSKDPLTRLFEEEFVRKQARFGEVERVLVIVLREGERPIGTIGLHEVAPPAARGADLGIAVGEPDCWGQGYGTEAIGLLLDHAFDDLNLHRVGLTCYDFNARGLACYEKLGFVREGTRRESFFREGRWVDEVLMGILAREWRARGGA